MHTAFEDKIVHTQYCVQNKRLDLYFPKYKFGIENDEYYYIDRNFEDEQIRRTMIEEKPDCRIIRTDPDAPDFSNYRLINQICMHIKQSTTKSTKNLLIDNLSKKLLEAAI